MDLYHTEVPSSQRGKGIGGVLAQVVFISTGQKFGTTLLICSNASIKEESIYLLMSSS